MVTGFKKQKPQNPKIQKAWKRWGPDEWWGRLPLLLTWKAHNLTRHPKGPIGGGPLGPTHYTLVIATAPPCSLFVRVPRWM